MIKRSVLAAIVSVLSGVLGTTAEGARLMSPDGACATVEYGAEVTKDLHSGTTDSAGSLSPRPGRASRCPETT
jgi:hypothetical protein